MSEWRWLPRDAFLAAHALQMQRYGGLVGVRDEGMLESAMMRPQHLAHYSGPDVYALAASYAYGLVTNHPFLDGNKRAGFLSATIFLELNGCRLAAPEAEAVKVFLDLAAGKVEEEKLAEWFRGASVPL